MASDTAGVALYVRLSRVLCDRIEAGEWKPGSHLPTLPELSQQFGVARVTVRQALALLAKRGLIQARRGVGTVVVSDAAADPALRRAINDPWQSDSVDIEMLAPVSSAPLPTELARGAGDNGPWRLYRKRHRSAGLPFVLMSLYLRADVAQALPRGSERRRKLAQLLQTHHPVPHLREEVTTTHAGVAEGADLECALGEPLIRMRRWYTAADGALVMAGTYLYRAERFVLDIRRDLTLPGVFAGITEPEALCD